MKVWVWAPEFSSPGRSRSVCRHRAWLIMLPFRRPRNGISFRVYLALGASLLFDLHGLIAAGNGPVPATGDDHFRSALCADVPLSDLICHFQTSFLGRLYLISIRGCPCLRALLFLASSLSEFNIFQVRRNKQFGFRDRLDILRGEPRIDLL